MLRRSGVQGVYGGCIGGDRRFCFLSMAKTGFAAEHGTPAARSSQAARNTPRGRLRPSSQSMMAMFSPFHAMPFQNAIW